LHLVHAEDAAMKTSVVLLAAVTLLAGTIGWAGAEMAVPGKVHRGTGIVTAVSPTGIVLKEAYGHHAMAIDGTTRIVIDPEARVERYGVGDYVAEECVPDGKGGVRAVKLALLRAAWMDNASPEN
jgi:hypothetical protein